MLTPPSNSAELSRRHAIEHALLVLLPLLVTGFALFYAYSGGYAAGDFRQSFYVAALRFLHHGNIYSWTHAQWDAGVSFPYPALTVVLLVPFTWLPVQVAGAMFMALCIAATLGLFGVLGVHDWRVYGAAMLWCPVVIGWQTGNLTLPVVFGVALIWRYRDRPVMSGLLVALVISVKPTSFPFALWLVATRRWTAAGYAVLAGLLANVVAWTLVGWGGIERWLHLISAQSRALYRTGYSLIALLAHLGIGRAPGSVVEFVAAAVTVAWCIRRGWRQDDLAAYVLAAGLMLLASPLVDSHYFAIVLVPLAIVRPRLGWLWLAPLALWLCPATNPAAWEVGLWWLAASVILERTLRMPGESTPREILVPRPWRVRPRPRETTPIEKVVH